MSACDGPESLTTDLTNAPLGPGAAATPPRELAGLFLRLGTTAFGGPAAHIALMQDEVVRRRGWLTRAAFLDLLGAAHLIPGPNSTELAIRIGHRRGGRRGLVVAALFALGSVPALRGRRLVGAAAAGGLVGVVAGLIEGG